MGAVVIGIDPHKRSATIEVMAGDETILDGGRFAADVDGYRAKLVLAKRFAERTWAIEGCNGIGRHIAHRLLDEWRDGGRRPTEAVRAHAGVRDRAGPQNRRHRRALGRAGRHPHVPGCGQ